MKKTLIAIAFAAASTVMFAQTNAPAPTESNAPAKPAKVHKHAKKGAKKAPKTENTAPKQ